MNDDILKPLLYRGIPKELNQIESLEQLITSKLVAISPSKVVTTFQDANEEIVKGGVVLLLDGIAQALSFNLVEIKSRSSEEPAAEKGGTSSGSGSTESFFVASAKGKNITEATNNIQNKLSRLTFLGQRLVIFLSEDLAKRGIKDIFDNIGRTPLHSIRGDLLIIKGATAKEALMMKYPLEDLPAIATLKEHRVAGGRGDQVLLSFLISANRDGIWPTLPMLKMSRMVDDVPNQDSSVNPEVLEISGVGIFNKDLQLEGMLSNEDKIYMLVIMGLQNELLVVEDNDSMNASVELHKLKSSIEPEIAANGAITFHLNIKGQGVIKENNSSIDLRTLENIERFEKMVAKKVAKRTEELIKRVQKEYGYDIFGFGEVLHRKEPKLWKEVKENWLEIFPEVAITVDCDVTIKEIGLDGPSLL